MQATTRILSSLNKNKKNLIRKSPIDQLADSDDMTKSQETETSGGSEQVLSTRSRLSTNKPPTMK